jgi:flagellar hook-associated protein 3 FlgL
MVSSLDAPSQRFLRSVAQIQKRIDRAQNQLGSKKRLEKASDGPDQVSDLLRLRGQIARNAAIKQNLTRVKTEVDTGEEMLSQAVSRVERAAVLGTEGTGTTQTDATRATLADEVADIMQQMVGFANTAIDGRYIFAGDADQTAPFALDSTSSNGVKQLVDSTEPTRQVETQDGTTFVAALNGSETFNPVFTALTSLHTALLSNDSAAIKEAVTTLQDSGAHLNRQLGSYGALQNRVSDALNSVEQTALTLQTRLSGVEDADLTEAITELAQGKLQLDAALQARSLVPQTSLFDVL